MTHRKRARAATRAARCLWLTFAIPAVASASLAAPGSASASASREASAGPYVVDAFERVVYRVADGASLESAEPLDGGVAAGFGSTCFSWDDLSPLTPPPGFTGSDAHQPPLFDSRGCAWVVNTRMDGSVYEIRVRRSVGSTGAWSAWQTIVQQEMFAANAEATLDRADRMTVVYRDITQGVYRLYAVRSTPDGVWQNPAPIHTSNEFFQAVRVGSDAVGNVAVAFDPRSPSPRIWTKVFDAASQAWQPAQPVSPPDSEALLPAIVRNASGSAMYLVYLLRGNDPGIRAHRWIPETRSWGPAEFAPGTQFAGYQVAVPGSRIPAIVDPAGNLTLLWENAAAPFTVFASARLNGVWQAPAPQLPAAGDSADLENFAGLSAASDGRVLAAVSRVENGLNRLYALRYSPASGWQVDNPYNSTVPLTTRVRTAPLGPSGGLITALGQGPGGPELISLVFDGEHWVMPPLDIPGSQEAFFHDLARVGNVVLLVFEGEFASVNLGISATWLRPPLGDLNTDGTVDIADLGALLTAYQASAGGDLDDDGDTDLADLGLLLTVIGGC